MTDLDSKLADILTNLTQKEYWAESGVVISIKPYIAQIKQAFADEREREQGFTAKDLGLMTGQEWYSRFEKELPRIGLSDAMNEAILEAAKRAAGLEGNS